MRQVGAELSAEYDRIHARASEDPGTAGDEGESNWATLLTDWLPPNFHVVTKGRVLGTNGILSPQLDVLVLHPAYPQHLREKKVYLAGGVVAAFECKLTLRNEHFKKVGETCGMLRSLLKPRTGSPYEELHSPLIFGLLAHTCQMGPNPALTIGTKLQQILQLCPHPRDVLGVLCVNDLSTWERTTLVVPGPPYVESALWPEMTSLYGWPVEGAVDVRYLTKQDESPILHLLGKLLQGIAWEFPDVRGIANYWRSLPSIETEESAVPGGRSWPLSAVLSSQVIHGIEDGAMNDDFDSKWSMIFI
jgi:hypothetical protein